MTYNVLEVHLSDGTKALAHGIKIGHGIRIGPSTAYNEQSNETVIFKVQCLTYDASRLAIVWPKMNPISMSVVSFTAKSHRNHVINLTDIHPDTFLACGVVVADAAIVCLKNNEPQGIRKIFPTLWSPELSRGFKSADQFSCSKRVAYNVDSVEECRVKLVEEFSTESTSLQFLLTDSHQVQILNSAVLSVSRGILDARPSTGLHWRHHEGKPNDSNTGSEVTPHLVRYQLENKLKKHNAFLDFLARHPDKLWNDIDDSSRGELAQFGELIQSALSLCRLQSHCSIRNSSTSSQILLQAVLECNDAIYCIVQQANLKYKSSWTCVSSIRQATKVQIMTSAELVGYQYGDRYSTIQFRHSKDVVDTIVDQIISLGGTLLDGYENELKNSLSKEAFPHNEYEEMKSTILNRVIALSSNCMKIPLKMCEEYRYFIGLIELSLSVEQDSQALNAKMLDYCKRFEEYGFARVLFSWHSGQLRNPWAGSEPTNTTKNLNALLCQPPELRQELGEFLLVSCIHFRVTFDDLTNTINRAVKICPDTVGSIMWN